MARVVGSDGTGHERERREFFVVCVRLDSLEEAKVPGSW